MNNMAELAMPDEVNGDVPPGLHHLQTLSGHQNVIYECSWSPRGRVLVSVAADRTICRWDLQRGKPVHSTQAFYDFLFGVAWSPNGRYLATASFDKTVRIIYAGSGKQARVLRGHTGPVFSVAWSRNSRFLASASDDKTVRLWDSDRKWRSQVLEGHEDWVLSVAWSFQEHLLASGSRDHTVRVWDSREMSPRFILKGHSNIVNSVAWSPNGRHLASASDDGEVRVWNSQTGRQVIVLSGHRSAVLSVRFSPDGRLLASKSSDGTVQLWDCYRWQLVAELAETVRSDLCNGLSFHPNKHQLATLSHDQKGVRIWQLNYGVLLGDTTDEKWLRALTCPGCSEQIPASMVNNRLKRGRDTLTCPVCDTLMPLIDSVTHEEGISEESEHQTGVLVSKLAAISPKSLKQELAHNGQAEESTAEESEPITKILKPSDEAAKDANDDGKSESFTKALGEVEEKKAASETETAVPPATE